MAKKQRHWTRDQTLVAFNLYCRTPFGRLHARNPEIIAVARALGRTPGSLAMKCCNLAAFDSAQQARGIRGLRGGSQQDRSIWDEFERDPENLAYEAEEAYARLLRQDLRTTDSIEWEDVLGLDRSTITKVRVNQHFFRSIVLAGYQSRCAVCELPFTPLLVAAHIVPWSVDKTLRMNPRNGICLCVLHERAFDRGLIIFSADYKIAVPSSVRTAGQTESVASNFIRFDGMTLNLPDRWHPDPTLLDRHTALVQRRI